MSRALLRASADPVIRVGVSGDSAVAWKISSTESTGLRISASVRGGPSPASGKRLPQEERLRGFLEKNARFSVGRHVVLIVVPNAPTAEIDDLAVCEPARRSMAQIIERDHATDRAVRHRRTQRSGEKFVHPPALVGFHVPEGDPPEPLEGKDVSKVASASERTA